MFGNLRLTIKLSLIVSVFVLGLVVVGMVGIRGMQAVEAGLKTVYEDRTVCLGQLATVMDLFQRAHSRLLLVSEPGEESSRAKLIEEITRLDAESDGQWAAYTATYLVPEEKVLADHFTADLARYRAIRKNILTADSKGNAAEAVQLTVNQIREPFFGAATTLRQLVDLQVRIAKVEDQKAEQSTDEHIRIILLAAALALGIGSGLGLAISRSITLPIGRIIGVMDQLAAGNLEIAIDGQTRRDEVGDISRAVTVFKQNALTARSLQEQQETIKSQAAAEKRRALETLADNFDRNIKVVVQTVAASAKQMFGTAQALSRNAQKAAERATVVAVASEQATGSVETVAAAAEELSSSIGEIARQVAQAASVSSHAVVQSGETGKIVDGLAEAVGRIGEVVRLISDIASQTNLLALNATIEAARAGEAGKGFAVVAGEVKNLANQTARATDEISGQIAAVQQATAAAVQAIGEVTATIGEISQISAAISAAVEEQGAATREIARNVEQAARGTEEVTANIEDVTRASGETGQGANEVQKAARDLAEQADRLGREVDDFIRRIHES